MQSQPTGPMPPSPGALPGALNALQASKSKSMEAGASLLKGEDSYAASCMNVPSTSPTAPPMGLRPHPFSAPVVMMQQQ
eukprot:scaffold274334_cov17-Tisochrysis_lutea.AAC.1